MRYGTNAQKRTAAQDVGAGLLFALWVTDASDAPLQISPQGAAIVLTGAKSFCSAAGYADRAIVTATVDGEQPSMLLLALNCGERVLQSGAALHGMRATITRRVDFSNCTVTSDALLGVPGDYLREPEFSTGAWRSSAVALGGLAALLALAREQNLERFARCFTKGWVEFLKMPQRAFNIALSEHIGELRRYKKAIHGDRD
jgi:alkylation response protein AidB-like acyl-CoA dehydrogenase